MSANRDALQPGIPGSFPLPNAGNQGNTFRANMKMHPAALATGPKSNPLNAGRPAMAGKK